MITPEQGFAKGLGQWPGSAVNCGDRLFADAKGGLLHTEQGYKSSEGDSVGTSGVITQRNNRTAHRRMLTGALLLGVASMLGGCSNTDMFSTQGAEQWFSKPFTGFSKHDWATPSTATNMSQLREVTPEDFVDASGQCSAAAAPAESAPAPGAPAGTELGAAATVAGGIALTMTECQVVQRAGSPQRVDLGAGAGGERTAVLTYTQGPWPGIYRFRGGRLAEIEGVAQPEKPKPAPRKKRNPPKTAAR